MISFADGIATLEAAGYANAPAMAKLAHDIVLKAMEKSGFARNVTIKGGVVMSSLTGDIRRATMDMDVDFVRYGLTDENIDRLILRANCKTSRLSIVQPRNTRNTRKNRVFRNPAIPCVPCIPWF